MCEQASVRLTIHMQMSALRHTSSPNGYPWFQWWTSDCVGMFNVSNQKKYGALQFPRCVQHPPIHETFVHFKALIVLDFCSYKASHINKAVVQIKVFAIRVLIQYTPLKQLNHGRSKHVLKGLAKGHG